MRWRGLSGIDYINPHQVNASARRTEEIERIWGAIEGGSRGIRDKQGHQTGEQENRTKQHECWIGSSSTNGSLRTGSYCNSWNELLHINWIDGFNSGNRRQLPREYKELTRYGIEIGERD